MAQSPKEEFIELIAEVNRGKGLDGLTSKIIGILFIEPEEVSMEELAKRTGYSLSAVSTSMKMLAMSGFVKRVEKPRTKKAYFFFEKDMLAFWKQSLVKMSMNIAKLKSRMPGIIERFRQDHYKSMKGELRIAEKYYRQLCSFEGLVEKLISDVDRMEDAALKNAGVRNKT